MSEVKPTPNTEKLVAELADDREIVLSAIAAYKAKGVAGLLSVLPGALQELQEDVTAAIAAAPEIRAGYRTTEFWITSSVLAGNAIYIGVTGKSIPFDVNATATALAIVYIAARAIVKRAK